MGFLGNEAAKHISHKKRFTCGIIQDQPVPKRIPQINLKGPSAKILDAVVEFKVEPAFFQELAVVALFDDAAVFHD